MQPFEIVRDEDGRQIGTNGATVVTAHDHDARMFRRRAVRGLGGPGAHPVEWLVVEQCGVRVYVTDKGVVITRADLMP